MSVKRGMRFNRRGISPIIATVLLVAFAVAIGAMVMNWGKDVVANVGDCNDVKLEVQTINGAPLFCYDTLNTRINVMVKNTGDVDIEELRLRVIGSDFSADEVAVEDSKMRSGSIISKNIPYMKSGRFRVEFIPVITFAGKEKVCSDKAIAVDSIESCNK